MNGEAGVLYVLSGIVILTLFWCLASVAAQPATTDGRQCPHARTVCAAHP